MLNPPVAFANVDALSILVPLIAAGIGAASVAVVSRHLRRQELYVEAAQKINEYIDEAAEALNKVDQGGEFDVEPFNQAKRAINLACFHSKRLESDDVTGRLQVADFILWDVLNYEDHRGRYWAYRAIDDAMSAVVEFMILPRLWPPRRRLRHLPPHRLPNRLDLYRELTAPDANTERINWSALRSWVRQREKGLRAASAESNT